MALASILAVGTGVGTGLTDFTSTVTLIPEGEHGESADARSSFMHGPSMRADGESRITLNCTFILSADDGESYMLAYRARMRSPSNTVLTTQQNGLHKPSIFGWMQAQTIDGEYGGYVCEVDWHVEGEYLGTGRATLQVVPSCGQNDPRNSLISEYYSGEFQVQFRPVCSEITNSGGSANFSWSDWMTSQVGLHEDYGIARSGIFDHLEETVSQYDRGPVAISSGYRCPKHNRSIGGTDNSRHLYGDAGDLKPTQQVWNEAERDLLAAAARRAGATWIEDWGDGDGQTKSHVHADWR